MVQTAALFAVLVVGWHIPLPGLDLDNIPKRYSPLDSAPILFSIFALGLLPFFTVLACVEIAKLAVPPWPGGKAPRSGMRGVWPSSFSSCPSRWRLGTASASCWP